MVTDDRQGASRRPSHGVGSSNEREKCERSDLNARNSCWQYFKERILKNE